MPDDGSSSSRQTRLERDQARDLGDPAGAGRQLLDLLVPIGARGPSATTSSSRPRAPCARSPTVKPERRGQEAGRLRPLAARASRSRSTVIVGNSAASWNERIRPSRAAPSGPSGGHVAPVEARPGRASGRVKPPSSSNVVVLPAPFGPMRPTVSPARTPKRHVADRAHAAEALAQTPRLEQGRAASVGRRCAGTCAGSRAAGHERRASGCAGSSSTRRSASSGSRIDAVPARDRLTTRVAQRRRPAWIRPPGQVQDHEQHADVGRRQPDVADVEQRAGRCTQIAPMIGPTSDRHAAEHRHHDDVDARSDREGRRVDGATASGRSVAPPMPAMNPASR